MTKREEIKRAMEKAGDAWLAQFGNELEGWADIPMEVFADAALSELMTPTPAMVSAGQEAMPAAEGYDLPDDCVRVFTHMIAAA